MKRVSFLILLLLPCLATMAQKGVFFQKLTFNEALKKAETENKFVFVDCYTTWCGPCKYMANTVFSQELVGEYINPRFVSVKYDMEKDDGPVLGKRFQVVAYPSFLVLRPDGSLVHKILGSSDSDTFINRMKESFDDNKAYGAISKRYNEGERDKDFLFSCLETFITVKDSRTREIAGQLVKRLTDQEKTTEMYWFIYENPNISPQGSENEVYLFKNESVFRKSIVAATVDSVLYERYKAHLLGVIKEKDSTLTITGLKQMIHEINRLKLPAHETLEGYASIATAVKNRNINRIILVCDSELEKLKDGYKIYIEMCDKLMAKANPTEKKRWITVGEKLVKYAGKDQNIMNLILKHLEKL